MRKEMDPKQPRTLAEVVDQIKVHPAFKASQPAAILDRYMVARATRGCSTGKMNNQWIRDLWDDLYIPKV